MISGRRLCDAPVPPCGLLDGSTLSTVPPARSVGVGVDLVVDVPRSADQLSLVGVTALSQHICCILGGSARKQVSRPPYARRVITVMQNPVSVRNWTHHQAPCPSMRTLSSACDLEQAISINAKPARPCPTWPKPRSNNRASQVDSAHKSHLRVHPLLGQHYQWVAMSHPPAVVKFTEVTRQEGAQAPRDGAATMDHVGSPLKIGPEPGALQRRPVRSFYPTPGGPR